MTFLQSSSDLFCRTRSVLSYAPLVLFLPHDPTLKPADGQIEAVLYQRKLPGHTVGPNEGCRDITILTILAIFESLIFKNVILTIHVIITSK